MQAEAYGDSSMFVISHFDERDTRLIGDGHIRRPEEEMMSGDLGVMADEGVD